MHDESACNGSKLSAVTCKYESTHDMNEYEIEEKRNEIEEDERIEREGINEHRCRTNGMTKETR